MTRRFHARLTRLEAAWYQDQCRRLDALTEQELAEEIGAGSLEVFDALSLEELDRVASGDRQALQRFWDHLAAWQAAHP
jgi:hypothetical protein